MGSKKGVSAKSLDSMLIFAKKAETSTMSKALSKLGFNADVFLGEHDNPIHVELMEAKARIESGDEESMREAQE